MALSFTTYAELQAAIGEELNRPDLVASGVIPGFITLAEAKMKRELRRQVDTAAFTFITGTSSLALPAAVSELRSIVPAVSVARPRGGKPLTKLTWDNFNEKRSSFAVAAAANVVPQFYTILKGVVYVADAPSDANLDFTISYYKNLVSVSSDLTLLLEAPDMYFYGALSHSAPYLEHDERVPLWGAAFTDAIDSMNKKLQAEEFSQPLQQTRLPINFGGGRII
jgi:hypothetical protein